MGKGTGNITEKQDRAIANALRTAKQVNRKGYRENRLVDQLIAQGKKKKEAKVLAKEVANSEVVYLNGIAFNISPEKAKAIREKNLAEMAARDEKKRK